MRRIARIAALLAAATASVCAVEVAAAEERGEFRLLTSFEQAYTTIEHLGGRVTGGSSSGTASVIESSGGPFVVGAHHLAICVILARASDGELEIEAPCTVIADTGDQLYVLSGETRETSPAVRDAWRFWAGAESGLAYRDRVPTTWSTSVSGNSRRSPTVNGAGRERRSIGAAERAGRHLQRRSGRHEPQAAECAFLEGFTPGGNGDVATGPPCLLEVAVERRQHVAPGLVVPVGRTEVEDAFRRQELRHPQTHEIRKCRGRSASGAGASAAPAHDGEFRCRTARSPTMCYWRGSARLRYWSNNGTVNAVSPCAGL